MNNDTKNQKRKYPIDLPIRVFPAVIALVVLISMAYAALIISLTIKFALPVAVGFGIIFVTGIPLYMYCYINSIVKWQIWAYNSVNDIRELDSMQTLLSYLCIEDYNRHEIWMSKKDLARRKAILDRYYGPYHFEDDHEIGDETTIDYTWIGWAHLPGMQRVVISDRGIKCPNGTFYRWEQLRLDDVLNSSSWDRRGRYVLTYQCPNEWVEIPLRWLDIDYIKLKHLLYVYRMRHTLQQEKVENTVNESAILAPRTNVQNPYKSGSRWLFTTPTFVNEMLKFVQKIRGLLVFMLFVAFIALVYTISTGNYKRERLKKHYSGFVIKKEYYKEITRGPKAFITLAGSPKDIVLDNYRYFDTVSVGDYISKKEGELKEIVVKGNDTLVFDDEHF